MGFFTWLESTSLVQQMAESLWLYPTMLSFHALGLSLTVGVVLILDLRLLGVYRAIPIAPLARLLGLAWVGFWLNAVTGLIIFPTQATNYVTSLPFMLKMLSVGLGAVNLVILQRVLRSDGAAWDSSGEVPSRGRNLALISAFLWTMAVVTGRLIAYI